MPGLGRPVKLTIETPVRADALVILLRALVDVNRDLVVDGSYRGVEVGPERPEE